MSRILILAAIVAVIMIGWNSHPTAVQAQTTTRTPTATVRPTRTPRPTATRRAATTATTLRCTVDTAALNLRQGPGTSFAVIGKLTQDDLFVAEGRNGGGTWVWGRPAGASRGWTSAAYLDCPGAVGRLDVTTARAPTPRPTATPRATARTTAAARAPAATPTTRPAAAPASAGGITPLQPLDPVLDGHVTFKWRAPDLGPGEGYELVFWAPGQDPLTQGVGVVGAKEVPEASVNFASVVDFFPQFQRGGTYVWGVLHVELMPYSRVRYLGGGRQFLIAAAAPSASGDDDDDDAPRPETGPK